MSIPIVHWREVRGLSRGEAAEKLGLPYTTLARLEAGEGCKADTAFDILERAPELTLLDLCSETKRKEILDARRKGGRAA